MTPLATPGALVRVTPLDDLQYWAGPESPWEFVKDPTPFVFRVEACSSRRFRCPALVYPAAEEAASLPPEEAGVLPAHPQPW
jgi:hypothetical protein